MTKKRWILLLAVLVVIAALAPAYVRLYRVSGYSDAPSFLVGDRFLANKLAYDVRLPYTDIVFFSHSAPKSGDVILFRSPDSDLLVFKRVIGCPGDRVAMRDNHLEINGTALQYARVQRTGYEPVAEQNRLGEIIEMETGVGPPHLMTHSPDTSLYASFGPVDVPRDQYFVVGDNRDHSRDSRMYGCVPRRSILGKVIRRSQTGE